MDRGTLEDLADARLITPECLSAVLRQAAAGLAYMHGKQRTHDDVRPENILLQQSRASDCLVVKLADFGLASRSAEVGRDRDLLAYAAWCAALDRPFQCCPGPEEQPTALADFAAAAPLEHGRQLWGQLAEVLRGLWQGSLAMVDVEAMGALQGHEVRVPHSAEAQLLERAKESLKKRSSLRWTRGKQGWLQQRWQASD